MYTYIHTHLPPNSFHFNVKKWQEQSKSIYIMNIQGAYYSTSYATVQLFWFIFSFGYKMLSSLKSCISHFCWDNSQKCDDNLFHITSIPLSTNTNFLKHNKISKILAVTIYFVGSAGEYCFVRPRGKRHSDCLEGNLYTCSLWKMLSLLWR